MRNNYLILLIVLPVLQKESSRAYANEILDRSEEFADEYVHVKQIAIPSLGNVTQLGKDEAFSLFIPKHQKLAAELIELFLGRFFYSITFLDILCN